MNRFATSILALVLAGVGSTALAEQTKDQISTQTAKPQPVQMSDAQLDAVAAGQVSVGLITITIDDVPIDIRVLNNSVNGNTIQVPVAANVGAAVAVLGNAAALAQQFGRQTQN